MLCMDDVAIPSKKKEKSVYTNIEERKSFKL